MVTFDVKLEEGPPPTISYVYGTSDSALFKELMTCLRFQFRDRTFKFWRNEGTGNVEIHTDDPPIVMPLIARAFAAGWHASGLP